MKEEVKTIINLTRRLMPFNKTWQFSILSINAFGLIPKQVLNIYNLCPLCLVFLTTAYFERSLRTGTAVLTAKHQKGLHTQNCVLLQLYYIWGEEIHTASCTAALSQTWGRSQPGSEISIKRIAQPRPLLAVTNLFLGRKWQCWTVLWPHEQPLPGCCGNSILVPV